MIPNLIIREAKANDCSQMLNLVKELAIYEKAPDEVTVSLEDFREAGFGKQPVWWAYVAEHENKIVGMALYYIRFSTWKGKRMYLEDIVITELWRGKKIGSMLFEKLIQVAKEKKYDAICWQVLDWNKPAINFYKKYNASFDGSWLNASLVL